MLKTMLVLGQEGEDRRKTVSTLQRKCNIVFIAQYPDDLIRAVMLSEPKTLISHRSNARDLQEIARVRVFDGDGAHCHHS
jgi:hypothetical protein